MQQQEEKTEVLGEQLVLVPHSWFYLYGDRLVKPGVKKSKVWKVKIECMVSGYMKITDGADISDKCSLFVPIP